MADPVPPRDIALSGAAEKDIGTLLSVIGRLREIVDSSRKLTPSISISTIIGALKLDSNTQRLLIALENIQQIKLDLGGSDVAYTAIERSLSDDVLKRGWRDNKETILYAINTYDEDNPISLTLKAQKLSYQYENLLQDVEIITDARPVFNSKRDAIVEFIITHTLSIISSSIEGPARTLNFALDAADLAKLRRACERATLKAKTVKTELGKAGKWPVGSLRDDGDSS